MARPSPSECLSLVRVGLIESLGPCCWLFEVQESFPDLSCVTQFWGRPNTTVAESRAQVFRNRRIIPRISLLPVLTIYRSRCAGKSKGGESGRAPLAGNCLTPGFRAGPNTVRH